MSFRDKDSFYTTDSAIQAVSVPLRGNEFQRFEKLLIPFDIDYLVSVPLRGNEFQSDRVFCIDVLHVSKVSVPLRGNEFQRSGKTIKELSDLNTQFKFPSPYGEMSFRER